MPEDRFTHNMCIHLKGRYGKKIILKKIFKKKYHRMFYAIHCHEKIFINHKLRSKLPSEFLGSLES